MFGCISTCRQYCIVCLLFWSDVPLWIMSNTVGVLRNSPVESSHFSCVDTMEKGNKDTCGTWSNTTLCCFFFFFFEPGSSKTQWSSEAVCLTRKDLCPFVKLITTQASSNEKPHMYHLTCITVMSYLAFSVCVCVTCISPVLLLVLCTLKATGFRLFIDYQNQNLTSFAP